MESILLILMLLLNSCCVFSTPKTECQLLNTTVGKKEVRWAWCHTTTMASGDFTVVDPTATNHLVVQCEQEKTITDFPKGKFALLRKLTYLNVQNCLFGRIRSGALLGLGNLENIRIVRSQNDSVHPNISEDLFDSTPKLIDVDFQWMGIRQLPGRLLCNTNLISLNLMGNKFEHLNEIGCGENSTCCSRLTHFYIDYNRVREIEKTHLPFPDLLVLQLSFNRIQRIQNGAFDRLKELQSLNLTNNDLDRINSTLFEHNSKLKLLDLSFNQIEDLPPGIFSRLTFLQILNLGNNNLTNISQNAFPTLLHLLILKSNHNRLASIPNLRTFRNLMVLDLSFNKINYIAADSFLQLEGLKYLSLNGNPIQVLENTMFRGLSNIEIILLKSNEISSIEEGTFDDLKQLKTLVVSGNKIEDMKSVFRAVQSTLDLRNNKIQLFDFSFINSELVTIFLHDNNLSAIAKPDVPLKNYKLQNFFAAGNKLQHFSASYFPASIRKIVLAHNNISTVHNLNLRGLLPFLEFVQLENNSISEIPDSDIRYAEPISLKEEVAPLVILYSNPITCSCENNWLLYDSTSYYAQYPKIRKDMYCKVVYSQSKRFSAIVDVQTMKKDQLLCEIDQMCPNQCKCFNNKLSENILDCYNATWKHLLPILQENFTTIFFDGNTNIESVLSQLLINSSLVNFLYTNNSDLTSIDKDMFKGVPEVTVLHLEENHLSAIDGNEFQFTTKLEKLFLHGNDLQYISPDGFRNLHRLKVLTLHKNKLHQPQFWTMISSNLFEITFSGNELLCNCEYTVPFNQWVINNQDVEFKDLVNTYCSDNQTLISHLNNTSCLEVIKEKEISLFAIVVPTVSILLLLTVVLILLYFYSLEIKVWLYSRYGDQLFHNKDDDENKIFDAFISYANEDGEWVVEELIPRLNDYRLCIHQRDFPAGGLIAESIAYAVENSCVTIALLTPNYLQSEWCRFEFEHAHVKLLENKCKRLLVVVLEQVEDVDIDSNLRAYLKTNTYLDINDALFWTKLKNALPEFKTEPQMQGETSL